MNKVGYEYGEKVRWVVELSYGGYMGNHADGESLDIVDDIEDAMMFTTIKHAKRFLDLLQPFCYRLCRVALTMEVITYEDGE